MTATLPSASQPSLRQPLWRRRGVRLAAAALLAGGALVAGLGHDQVRALVAGEAGPGARITVTVNSVEGLERALARAADGSVIRLAPGEYSEITLKGLNFARPVTITSAQPDHPARIARLSVTDSSGLFFHDLEFAAQNGTVRDIPYRFINVRHFTLERVFVHGPDNLDIAYQIAPILFRNSEDVALLDSRFTRLYLAVQILDVKGFRAVGNEFWNIRSDAMRGGGISDALYAYNVCTNFHPAEKDHPDCVQLWSTNEKEVARNIVIRDNLVVRGDGDPIQGVFVRDTHSNLPFENVQITDNLLIGTLFNGICIDGVNGAQVTGNEVIALGGQKAWIRLQNAHRVELHGNSAPKLLLIQSDGIHDTNNRFGDAGPQKYRARVEAWLAAKAERRHKDSQVLPKILAAAP